VGVVNLELFDVLSSTEFPFAVVWLRTGVESTGLGPNGGFLGFTNWKALFVEASLELGAGLEPGAPFSDSDTTGFVTPLTVGLMTPTFLVDVGEV
jgi:hypothetical protein